MKKKLLSSILCLVLLCSFVSATAFAASDSEYSTITEYLPDGSYIVTTLQVDTVSARSITKSATKTSSYYNIFDDKLASFSTKATFTYTSGQKVQCTNVTTSKVIYDSTISFVGATTSKNNSSIKTASGTGKGTFKTLFRELTMTVTVTCDYKGNIS